MSDLTVQSFTLGMFQTNCFVLHRAGHRTCWIIDAGEGPEAMIQYIREHELEPEHVLLTHAHLDHILGLEVLREVWPTLPILIHPLEKHFLTDPMANLSGLYGLPMTAPPATGTLDCASSMQLQDVHFELRHTPGHSPGGVTFYAAQHKLAIVGDTLFAGSIGRYDFPTSDGRQLMESIREQLLTLPDETRILPGHGPESTIGQERATNPYLQP